MSGTPSYDLIIYGATGFVGQIITRYMAGLHGSQKEVKWAIAGRSEAKLTQLAASLAPSAPKLPVIVADAKDADALTRLCRQTRVVISTVGPYAIHGEPLVKACVTTGTDYCDLTGEIQWIHAMLQQYEAAAKDSGARIVNCCGFDSIPSDLGVLFLQQNALKQYGHFCSNVRMRVRKMRGGFSGGTIASMIHVIKQGKTDPVIRKVLTDPYSICPPASTSRPRQASVTAARYDEIFDSWTVPFMMAVVNEHVVLRSNALSEPAYGEAFLYNEGVLVGPGTKGRWRARGIHWGMAVFMGALLFSPSRWLLKRFILPSPGEGPSPDAQQNGFYDILFWGQTPDDKTLTVKVSGDRDPGYGSTAKMLGQAGICLAKDISKADKRGGFWTPATIFGSKLIERLKAHAGLSFDLLA